MNRPRETELRSQDAFFSKLSDSPCSDPEYTHASRVWDAFRCKTMADYHDTYLRFDSIHYYTTPALAWDAALRMTRVDLQLITYNYMYNFVDNSIRGGISRISTRHAQANNPSFPDTESHLFRC